MKYALIADIHGNLEALKAVIDEIEKEKVDDIYCLGDIVGYYPNPNECVELIEKYVKASVAGNHDYAAIGKIKYKETFTEYAKIAMEWTCEHLDKKSEEYLAELPAIYTVDDKICITHSNPCETDRWDYLLDESEITDVFCSFPQKICFNAHTHYPVIMMLRDEDVVMHKKKKVVINPDCQYIINVGSVGQPRDKINLSSYVIYDSEDNTVEIKRVKYDIETVQKKVREACLPEFLAHRLGLGK